jgi:hypothetical protein
MDNVKRSNLDKALGQFIEAMRLFLVSELENKYGKNWEIEYYDSLSDKQKNDWDIRSRDGKSPANMIDYHNLGGFAIKHSNFFRKFFGKKASGLPTMFNQIADARNMIYHFDPWDDDKADTAYLQMIKIVKTLGMSELEEELRHLKSNKTVEKQIKEDKPQKVMPSTTAWFNNVRPHLDIREGNLDESVFAADLAEVSLGTGRVVYTNSSLFFEKTYFTAGLSNIAERVIKGLNGNEDGENRVISLQTGFGGGKTHTLITLYHLANAGSNIPDIVKENIKTEPAYSKANIAVFTNTTNDPVQGRKVDGLHIRTIWGELAYQLGGKELYEKIKDNDDQRVAPKGLFFDILNDAAPSLILIDELADYCVAASGVQVGDSTLSDQTISFMQELTESVAKVKKSVAVITLPASVQEVANSPKAAAILQSLEGRVNRVGADTRPVAEEEIFEVIRYRLFEGIGDAAVTKGVLESYRNMYSELWTELPQRSNTAEYLKMMERSSFPPRTNKYF